MPRLLFEKTGDAVYLSHLDLIRVFQRAFNRAGFMLKHSQGFSPKPYVSVALALSVGMHSTCEIMDFEAEDGVVPADLAEKLNETLPKGIRVREVYESGKKMKELSYLTAELTLEYDRGVPENAQQDLTDLFSRESIIVKKFTKKGETETDIRPMICSLQVSSVAERELQIVCTVCAQNPALNPMLLISAIETYLPECKPDFAFCRRTEVLDAQGKTFR